ncbi:hypothetical protein, partial [Acinetobacter baumannii]
MSVIDVGGEVREGEELDIGARSCQYNLEM